MVAYFGKPLYLFQIKANQGEILDVLEHCFAKAELRRPTAMNNAAVSIHRLC